MARDELVTGNVWEQYSQKVQDRMNNPVAMGEFTQEDADKAGAILIGDVDGNLEDEVIFQLDTLKESFLENGSTDFIIAENEEEGNKLWFARRNASPAVTIYGTNLARRIGLNFSPLISSLLSKKYWKILIMV